MKSLKKYFEFKFEIFIFPENFLKIFFSENNSMDSMDTSRLLRFLIGCIGTRLFIVYLAATKLELLPIMGKISLLPFIGFITIYLFGLRKTGIEVDGNVIWWNNLRPLHGLLFLLFAYFAINKNKKSWVILFTDTFVGLFSFLIHYKFIKL